MGARVSKSEGGSVRILLASSNAGKLREYRELAAGSAVDLELNPDFRELPPFEESAATFAEVSAEKALHYSRYTDELVLADDSGLVVPAIGGAPGVHSARYAGPHATDADNVHKLLHEMERCEDDARGARFVCVISVARQGRMAAVVSDFAEGLVAGSPRGTRGFGYDPVFFYPPFGKTFAQLSAEEKNRHSHRGKAFRKLLNFLSP